MKGTERNFIAAVAHVPGVVALRVEGLDKIEFARKIAPGTFIIGLIKVFDGHRNLITPDLMDMGREIIHAGADMVAAENVFEWCRPTHMRVDGLQLPFKVMWDMTPDEIAGLLRSNDDQCRVRQMGARGQIVLATTFIHKAFVEAVMLRGKFPSIKINLEGGIETHREYEHGLTYCHANYVTIGKAINDPVTIINNLLKGKTDG
jgi:putative N-acetylmannosamine-6-phosphate epimerase